MTPGARPCRLFLVAGEHSGDQLGGRLLAALKDQSPQPPVTSGVGGEAMAREGFASLFPLQDVAVMGPAAIMARLPSLLRRIFQTADAAVAARPDAVVILDSPEFTHPIARRVRRRLPAVPIIDYVSPSVWAWRPGRARKMRRYIDHVLAILPFEPAVHARLGGPACTYVGHPLIERLPWIRSRAPEALARRLGLQPDAVPVLVLPGSRPNEVKRLMGPFGGALGRLQQEFDGLTVILPAVESMREAIEAALPAWPLRPHIVTGEEDKFAAFRLARAALTASGTVTLELALSGTPMVVAYRIEAIAAPFVRRMIKAPSVVLPNLVLGENALPELLQEDCTPERLAAALAPLLRGGAVRERQLAALEGLVDRMTLPAGRPSEAAARIVLELAGCARRAG